MSPRPCPIVSPRPPSRAPAPAAASRLADLRAAPRRPGEASFFFHDAFFGSDAVKVLPGEYFVHHEDILIMTTLGSCIAACLWDREARVGGLNHFMLPEGGDSDSGRYGSFAMELLINEMMKRGATRATMEAKVFGGGQVVEGMTTLNIGARNTSFVMGYLQTERIPVVSTDVLDVYARKVCFLPASGKAMVKRLASANPGALLAQERAAASRLQAAHGLAGSVDLF
ncbi:MAG: chemoreceptor glutamine deamidase CheD [Burkholderiaceae bacterium]